MNHLAKKLSKIILFAALPLVILAGVFGLPCKVNAIVVNPGESIQAAINSLPAGGGTIDLAAGTYTISAPITITKILADYNAGNILPLLPQPILTLMAMLTPLTSAS